MERVMIIGCGGSGKSTLARKLGEKTELPVIHLDKLFWKPGWQPVSQEEFDIIHEKVISGERWIVDGNFGRTLPRRLAQCDTVIYLDFPRWVCMLGVLKRIFTTYGTVRPDMGEGCPERIDWDFLRWIWNFNRKHREKNYSLLSTAEHAKIHILKSRKEAMALLDSL